MMEPVEDSVSGSVNTASDISLGKEKFSLSIDLDNEKENETGDNHQPVNPPRVHVIFRRCSRHSS